nr:hypothetical protein [Legionella tunisiensis]
MRLMHGIFTLMFCLPVLAAEPVATTNDDAKALHLNWLDTSITPNQDFFTYANGTWQKQNPIPPEYASWGTFYILQEKNQKRFIKC